ncbi:MAG TPA: hydrogenase nickel incorporation protein HypB [Candidatus Cybelea sp.]
MQPELLEVEQAILRKNADLAQALRDRFARSETYVINLLSSPGAGKTTLLEETLRRFATEYRVGALVGDQATENDAVRLARSGAPVKQIATGAECRLDAEMVGSALEGLDWGDLDLLAIENVGNLICPAEYDLGEELRIVLFSTPEGEDKPLKYPLAFTTADLVILTKIDLIGATGFDRRTARENIQCVHPGVDVIELSARTGDGMEQWFEYLQCRIAGERVHAY